MDTIRKSISISKSLVDRVAKHDKDFNGFAVRHV